jgi:hypothetical protein
MYGRYKLIIYGRLCRVNIIIVITVKHQELSLLASQVISIHSTSRLRPLLYPKLSLTEGMPKNREGRQYTRVDTVDNKATTTSVQSYKHTRPL